ncbi:MAG: hypothetical protein LBQ73_10720 [Tannerellaceae bacterium]|jgi:uncharacterized protein YfaP (DUF2135 family)|nr:hypothetical protein [Tannerellaceae bacterium]
MRIIKFIKHLIICIAGCMCLYSCDIIDDLFDKEDKGKSEPTEKKLTEEELAQIEDDTQTIGLTASGIISGEITDADEIAALIDSYNQLESVEKAWLATSGLFVKFKDYGVTIWGYKQGFVDPPFFDINAIREQVNQLLARIEANTRAGATDKILPVNKKVAIFCGPKKEDGPLEKNAVIVMEILQDILESPGSGYDVTPYFGEDFTVESFKHLHDYGTIIIAAHGDTDLAIDGYPVSITTGEEVKSDSDYWEKYGDDHTAKRIGGRVNDERKRTMITISEKFIEHYYENESMSNTMFYTLSCYSMSQNMSWGKVLEKKRKREVTGVTIGYTDSNNIGHATAWYLFNALLGGYTVKESFANILPPECKDNNMSSDERGSWVAKLVAYPDTATASGNISFANRTVAGSVNITNPVEAMSYASRVVNLTGKCIGFTGEINGTVSLGENTYPLTFVNDDTFSQDIIIKSGINTIKVVCSGIAKDVPVCITAQQEIEVFGDFIPLPLYTALRWNTNGTDVDLHLVGPDGSDCYYRNKSTGWGGKLDVDDTNGFGPEHITIPELKKEGQYELWVHYYDPNGKGASQAWVYVETPSGAVDFGPHTLTNKGEKWHVCNISYPGGVIDPIDLRSASAVEPLIFRNMPEKK